MNNYALEKYLNDLLEVDKFDDYCHDGLQIEGRGEINKISIGVSFNEDFIEKSIDYGADAMLVHHGIFGKDFFVLKGYLKNRVEKVLENGMNLYGYHLPLDAHPELGNNISILRKLGLEVVERCDVGFIGRFKDEISFEKFTEMVRSILKRKDIIAYKNRDYVRNVCIISGGASSEIELLENKADTFLCGDVKEQTRNQAKEMRINFVDGGHYSTEVFGVQNLGGLIEEKFNIKC